MEVFNFLKFTILMVVLKISTSFESAAYLRVLKDKKLFGHTIYTEANIEESMCLLQCSQRTNCGSVNYHAAQKICMINNQLNDDEKEERSIIDSTGWKFFKKSKLELGEHLMNNSTSQDTAIAPESCKKIKEIVPSAPSGSYVINLQNPTKVYCDMETDGGGWIRIGRVQTTTTQDVEDFDIDNILSTNLLELDKAASQNFLLSGDVYPTLRSYVKFHEFRVFCTKPYHGRKNHASFSDKTTPQSKKFFDYLMGTYDGNQDNTCDALKYMPDDNSQTKSSDCAGNRMGTPMSVNKRFYRYIWYTGGETHVNVGKPFGVTRFECDDYFLSSFGFDNYGTWLFYVR